jgi:adenylate cyclase
VVTEHGGSIDKFAGDAVMAVFGAPRPEPDHAVRAVRCAVAMQARQSELNEEAIEQGLRPLHVGIGVNTGVVVAGTVGGGGRLEYTVLGDAVNVAQRLQSNAAAGEVLITGATAEAAKAGWFRMEPRGIQTVKGRREPIEVFRVLG